MSHDYPIASRASNMPHTCLRGRTQNLNESLQSKVWKKVSKDKFAGLYRSILVSQATILEHNFGHSHSSLLPLFSGFSQLAPSPRFPSNEGLENKVVNTSSEEEEEEES
ncbi:hypothetical protein GWK47_044006 [Chionoecetes opilio]|uniref:Uncharacterized protein n=1 Tax=Chionoecetes opilio TaxID=41210 RepID=A0A8J5CVM9_CHIOP|nr:hypothetical protein GWK47_044006 [Chionoecetes opilio]